MGTRENPMAGRYFNDPHFAAAVSSLAGAFAPPSPEEYLLAEQVKGERMTNEARNAMLGIAGNDFDKLGIVSDLYDPSNSYYSVDTDAATARRGQDVTAAASLDKARIDGAYGLAGTPLTYDQAIPGLSPEMAAAIGMPAMAPQSGAALGAPAPPMSETEMLAAIMAQQSPEDQRALLDPSTVNTVGPNGEAVITSEIEAIGQPAYINPGSTAAPDAITFERNGVRMGGSIVNGQFVDTENRPLTPQEAGTAAKIGSPVGTNADLGITGSNTTEYNRIQAITAESDMLIDSLAGMIQEQAGAIGAAGTIQNVGQNILQVAQELGTAFGGDENAIITPDMLSGVVNSGEAYDPTFARLRSGMLQLAYLNAQRDNPSGEVSRFSLERQIEALGQGLLANDQSTLAALGMTKEANARKRAAAEALQGRAPVAPAGDPAPAAGTPPPTGGATRLRFDANGDPIP